MSKLVISYRRTDSAAMAGRICDQLKARFGNDSVYMDIDSIPPGIDFRDHIYAALDQADVLLVIVGPKWLGTRRGGRHRITEDHDLVRAEVETALKRKIPVVPILVDGAVMPESASLPDSIKTFTRRNAAAVDSGVDFHQHMERLVHAIGPFVGAEPLLAWLLRRFGGSRRALRLALSTAAVIAVLVAALWGFWSFAPQPDVTAARGEHTTRGGTGGPWAPPAGRSHWVVDKSTVFLEPTGDKRQFFFVEPSSELTAQGAQPGSLLFDGRKISSDSYEGKLFVFAGRCGTRDYDASGPITNDDETVTLVGKAPRIDPESCLKIDEKERTLVFNYKRQELDLGDALSTRK